jgi:hypothetical protein
MIIKLDGVAATNEQIGEIREALDVPSNADLDSKNTGIITEAHDEINLTYIGSTNNLDTVEYSLNGSVVATLTFTYVGGVPVADNAILESVVKS